MSKRNKQRNVAVSAQLSNVPAMSQPPVVSNGHVAGEQSADTGPGHSEDLDAQALHSLSESPAPPPNEVPKAPEKRKQYIVLLPVEYKKELYARRSILSLTDAEAAAWVASKYIAPVQGKNKSE